MNFHDPFIDTCQTITVLESIDHMRLQTLAFCISYVPMEEQNIITRVHGQYKVGVGKPVRKPSVVFTIQSYMTIFFYHLTASME